MTHLKKYLALGLCSLMLCALVHAEDASDTPDAANIPDAAGSPADAFPMDPSVMKPWINSEVIGMVTEDVTADLKDDFYQHDHAAI